MYCYDLILLVYSFIALCWATTTLIKAVVSFWWLHMTILYEKPAKISYNVKGLLSTVVLWMSGFWGMIYWLVKFA